MGKIGIAGGGIVLLIGAVLNIWGGWQTAESSATTEVVAAEGKAKADALEFFPASEPVKDGDLEYQVVASPVWPMPTTEKYACSVVQIQLRVTNRGKGEVLFEPRLGFPFLKKSDVEWIRPQCYGCDHICVPPAPVSLAPGKAAMARLLFKLHDSRNGNTIWPERGICLSWEDHSGGYMGLEKLEKCQYSLELHYEKRGSQQQSLGEVQTKPITVEIRELKASAAVIKDKTEIYALANETWRVPVESKTSRIGLGFRIINRQNYSALMIPNIKAVKITSADGIDLPVKKLPSKVSHPFPEILSLWYDIAHTFAEPALLCRTGDSLELTWSDVAGNVWKIEGLQPGKYQVRYVVQGYLWPDEDVDEFFKQARTGMPPAKLPSFNGDVETASVHIEIRK
jgi:hypothetical protein